MSFWNNFTHGFAHGTFDRMMFGGGFGGFPMFNFSVFNTGCLNMPCCSTPMFFTPRYSMNFSSRYFTPTVNVAQMPLLPMPKINTSWDNVNLNFNYTTPNFCGNFDTFQFSNPTSGGPKRTSKSSTPSTLKGKYWTEMTDSEMQNVYGKYTRDITTAYTGTAEKLNDYLKGKGKLEGMGEAFMKAQEDYGISASVLVAIAMNESGGGTNRLSKENNNVMSIRDGKSGWKNFESVEKCIDYTASLLKKNYVDNPGKAGVSLKTLYQINAKYCPSSDPEDDKDMNKLWARNVEKFTKDVEQHQVAA